MKFKQGWIENRDGDRKDVIVESTLPLRVRDLILGGLMTLGGIIYMLWASFKKGSYEHEVGEFKTLNELGAVHDSDSDSAE